MYSNRFLSLFCMIADVADADVIVMTGKINIKFLCFFQPQNDEMSSFLTPLNIRQYQFNANENK